MGEIRYNTEHHAGGTPEARISSRLRNSGGDHADVVVQKGDGPTRAFTNIHHSANHVAPRDVRDTKIDEAVNQNPPGASKP
jgi:hypothetical protein